MAAGVGDGLCLARWVDVGLPAKSGVPRLTKAARSVKKRTCFISVNSFGCSMNSNFRVAILVRGVIAD